MRRRGPVATSPTVSSRTGTGSPDGNVLGVSAKPKGRSPSGGNDPTPATVDGTSTVDEGDDASEPQLAIANDETTTAIR